MRDGLAVVFSGRVGKFAVFGPHPPIGTCGGEKRSDCASAVLSKQFYRVSIVWVSGIGFDPPRFFQFGKCSVCES